MLYADLSWENRIEKLTPEQFLVFRENWPGLKKDVEQKDAHVYSRQRITLEEAHAIQQAGIKLEIEGVDGTMLTKMQDRGKSWPLFGDGRNAQPSDLVSGQAVQITIPDMALLMLDEVTWLDDACTEEVQRHLDEGWRILAVCPPNAQRRPDYIFGRKKP